MENDRMKICYLGNAGLPWTTDIANYFADRGEDVYFITFEEPQGKFRGPEFIKIKTRTGLFKYLLYTPKIRQIIRRINPDIIHINWATGYGLISYLLKFHPVVISCVGGDVLLTEQRVLRSPVMTLLLRFLIRIILNNADYLLPISKEIENKLISYGLPKDKMQIFFIEPVIKIDISGKDEAVVLSNRRLTRFYQVDVFIKAAAIVKREFPAVRIVVAGDGDKKRDYMRLAHELGLEDNIEFTGWLPQEEMFERVSRAAVFVSTSPSDGTPVSILEAMKLKTPIVAVDNQANREWIKNDSNGYLFNGGDYKKAADYISALLKDKGKRGLFSERSYRIIKEKADFERNIAELRRLYASLAAPND